MSTTTSPAVTRGSATSSMLNFPPASWSSAARIGHSLSLCRTRLRLRRLLVGIGETPDPIAAVNPEDLTGDVPGPLGAQEHCGLGGVIRPAVLPQRRCLLDQREDLRCEHAGLALDHA